VTVRFCSQLASSYSHRYQQPKTLMLLYLLTRNMSQQSVSAVFFIQKLHSSVRPSVEFWTCHWCFVISGLVTLVVNQGIHCSSGLLLSLHLTVMVTLFTFVCSEQLLPII